MGSLVFLKENLKSLINFHYVTNFLLATNYFLLKFIPYVCEYLFESCELEWRECEILMLLAVFVAVKSRKSSTFIVFVNTLFTFSKVANIVLYWREGPIHVIIFLLMWFLHFIFIPQPAYKGPQNIVYLRAGHLETEIQSDPRVTWLVCYTATWSPPCKDLEPVYAKLSHKFGGLNNLKFAKFDCNLYPDIAAKMGVNTSPLAKQLPTIALYQKGKETKRRPHVQNGSVYKFLFSYDNIVKDFDLNKLYYDCSQNQIKIGAVKDSAAPEVAQEKKTDEEKKAQ